MINPLVSVIISSYNHEDYVQKTIESLINQTYQNIELIIMDDGSKDSTVQKISDMSNRCQERFVRFYFESKENEGTCVTINKLLGIAQGEYVYMIASDDLAKPQAIEKEVDFLKANPDYALAVGDNEFIDSENRVCYWDKDRNIVYSKDKAKYLTFSDFLQEKNNVRFNSVDFGTYKTIYLSNHVPNGYLIRRSIFDKTGYFVKEAPLEDWYLMLQISKYAKMKFIPEILFSYRWHQSNTIKNYGKMDNFAIMTRDFEEKILSNIKESDVFPEVIDVRDNGVCYKTQGIPFLFEILTYRKGNVKYKLVKLFNSIRIKL